MAQGGWVGTTVLYVTPLRALLNNLRPRIESYGAWLGRTVALWHGDVRASERRRIFTERPDVLLTTPESIEAMLISRRAGQERFFSALHAVVIDELHSFASSDRGWHLLAVLERVERLAGRKLQRVGLSATVGNPEAVGIWLQGSTAGRRPVQVVHDDGASATEPDVALDYVGSMENAATVISRLYGGEKRLVFLESRRKAEELAFLLRERDVQSFVSHSSLSSAERRRSEQAFAEERDTVIVATSTLELGVDIGDLDRVIQIDAPRTVSSFLQRLGRSGRRPGAARNMLFLASDQNGLLHAAALLVLWKRGFVEDVVAPPHPRHLAAQQLLALALQEEQILDYLRAEEFLVEDSGLLMIGPRAEKKFGSRNFMDLLSSFVADLELRVVTGTKEIGFVSPLALPWSQQRERKPLVLVGRGWSIQYVDWGRRTVWVEEVSTKGDVKWPSDAVAYSYELCQAQRDVLLGANPDVTLSQRATEALPRLRANRAEYVRRDGLVLYCRQSAGSRLWTWAGLKANATLLAGLGLDAAGAENESVLLPEDVGPSEIRSADVGAVPQVDAETVKALKFSAALPRELAVRTLGERLADPDGAASVTQMALVRTDETSAV